MLLKISKKSIIISLFACTLYTNNAFASPEHSFWDKERMSHLNVVKDLKQGLGRIWYVDKQIGYDQKGYGGSLKTPFKSIRHALGRLKPGDTLVIGAGIYRERIYFNRSGTSDNRILIGPRGNGEVIIDASKKVNNWTPYKGSIYQAACSFKPTAVVVNEKPLFPEFDINKMSKGSWYYDKNNQLIYLSTFDGKNPDDCDIGVIIDDGYKDGFLINDADYITLYGLTVRFAGGRGISILGDYNKVINCDVKFNGGIGINMFQYGKKKTTDTEIANNHIYHNFLRNWPRGRYKNGGWGGGSISHSTPNTLFRGNLVHKNGGEGLLAHGGEGGSIFENNIVFDNWSVNIYVDNQPNCRIEKNLIFCHNPDPGDLYNNGDKNPRDNKNLRRLRAEGIMTADENSPATFQNAKIVNNVIIGCRRGINHYAARADSGLKNVLVADNTIIIPSLEGVGEKYIGIRIPYNNGNNFNSVYRNNIIYASNPDTYLLDITTDPFRKNDDLHGLTFDHNLWYHVTNPKPFHIGPAWQKSFDTDFKVWVMKCKPIGQGIGSMFVDPKFVNVNQLSFKAAELSKDSPAIGKAIPIEEVKTDFLGNLRDIAMPDIGALNHEHTD